ncbi:MAG: 3'-5' exonuclease [bacterium]|jgi:DNA polymerase III epsilon subunit-like protein|nr:3'-5' exonuclease [bacterium]
MSLPTKFFVFDFETTGTDPSRHAPIEIAAIILDMATLREVDRFETLIRPFEGAEFDRDAMATHGISLEELKAAPEPEAAFRKLKAFAERHGTMYAVAHNIDFDWEFLKAAEVRHKVWAVPLEKLKIDTQALAVWVLGRSGQLKGHGLKSLLNAFSLDHSGHHRAMFDVEMLCQAIRKLSDHKPAVQMGLFG